MKDREGKLVEQILSVKTQADLTELRRTVADRLTAGLELLWSMFTRARFSAVVELYTAARTDRQMRAALLPVAERHGPDWLHLRRVWLMVFAIALHNFPEGMAIGVGFSGGDPSVGVPLAAAIGNALCNLMESSAASTLLPELEHME